MARKKGTFETTGNFLVKMQEAIDPRTVVEKKADLINKDSWPYDGDTIYMKEGMLVTVLETEEVYMLLSIEKILNPDYSGWKNMTSSGETTGPETGDGNAPGIGGSIDSKLFEGFIPLSRDFSDDFNNDFAR